MKVIELTNKAVLEENILQKRCFACGEQASGGAGEHVIPKWLQTKCSLFDKKLKLLNETFIPYRNLTIPCCVGCNTGFLSDIENSVKPIFERCGTISAEEELCLARWLSKILIGILVKETALAFDRSKPNDGAILGPGIIDDLHHCHFVMQSARKKTNFRCLHGPFPFSLYLYSIPKYRADNIFDLSTNLAGQSIAIRIGRLGVIFVNDGGLQMEVGAKGPYGLSGADLSEVQFQEIAARVHYKAALRDATHLYLTSENDHVINVDQLHVKSFSGHLPGSMELQIFRKWNEFEFSYAMSAYTGVDQSEIFNEATQTCRTTLGAILRSDTSWVINAS